MIAWLEAAVQSAASGGAQGMVVRRAMRLRVSLCLSQSGIFRLAVVFDFATDSAAQCRNAVVDDAVIDLHTIAALAQNTALVQGVEVLGHIGLSGVDFTEQIAYVLLTLAQATDDFQAHRCRNDPEQLCRQFKDRIGPIEFGMNFFD